MDFLCFRPGGQTHGMPGSSGPGMVETEEAKGPQGRHNLNQPTPRESPHACHKFVSAFQAFRVIRSRQTGASRRPADDVSALRACELMQVAANIVAFRFAKAAFTFASFAERKATIINSQPLRA